MHTFLWFGKTLVETAPVLNICERSSAPSQATMMSVSDASSFIEVAARIQLVTCLMHVVATACLQSTDPVFGHTLPR